ncbi:conserved hypothetical protein [Altererythrobacter sp. B11]|uniref:hypothetical protein n=1 Tax=Altererythrobacter sp. B11 TaxID=2060312 RepID=UPI000DC6F1A5|nr:hypothetical protein [Altererythrobacter sp. B11]BBC72936.1 conserved hypothetical protein [Altererythrobacter sp. B11]
MTPVEQIARLVATGLGADPDEIVTAEEDALVAFGVRNPHAAWTRYIDIARLILTEFEPSEAMLAACDCPREKWRGMAEAALAEGPPIKPYNNGG